MNNLVLAKSFKIWIWETDFLFFDHDVVWYPGENVFSEDF